MLTEDEDISITEKESQIKEKVRIKYGELAEASTQGKDSGNPSSCCVAPIKTDIGYSQQLGYSSEEATSVPEGANLGLGCGNPHAIAQLKPGETVLDLGSGAGFDCFLAARRVGSTGHVIGVDMTPSMIEKARANAEKGNYTNVEFRLGEIEALPVADDSIDVIISNCVVNLSPNKPQVYKEAGRVLKPGGRIAISDVVATLEMPEQIKKDFELYSGCMAGATPIAELKQALQIAGFENVKIVIKEESRAFIKEWAPTSGAENYVASATIEASKSALVLQDRQSASAQASDQGLLLFSSRGNLAPTHMDKTVQLPTSDLSLKSYKEENDSDLPQKEGSFNKLRPAV
jgi:ubiquinone/menaquinone biosynthesis C-methylase UbiE